MIRPATPNDIEPLVTLARHMHAESRYARLSLNVRKVRDLLLRLIASENGCVIVSERDGRIVGAVVGMASEHWFCDELVATDFGLFLEPTARGGIAAARLIKAFNAWALERGAAMVNAGITTGVHTEDTAGFYEALGFRQVGLVYELAGK